MNASFRNVIGSREAPNALERMQRQLRAAVFPSEVHTVDYQPHNDDGLRDPTKDLRAGDKATADFVDRSPDPTRVRVILVLAVLSWMMVAVVIAWAISG